MASILASASASQYSCGAEHSTHLKRKKKRASCESGRERRDQEGGKFLSIITPYCSRIAEDSDTTCCKHFIQQQITTKQNQLSTKDNKLPMNIKTYCKLKFISTTCMFSIANVIIYNYKSCFLSYQQILVEATNYGKYLFQMLDIFPNVFKYFDPKLS